MAVIELDKNDKPFGHPTLYKGQCRQLDGCLIRNKPVTWGMYTPL